MFVICSLCMLKLAILKGFNLSLTNSLIRHVVDPFQRKISIELFDDNFRISRHLEPGNFIFKVEISLMIRASYTASLLIQNIQV